MWCIRFAVRQNGRSRNLNEVHADFDMGEIGAKMKIHTFSRLLRLREIGSMCAVYSFFDAYLGLHKLKAVKLTIKYSTFEYIVFD